MEELLAQQAVLIKQLEKEMVDALKEKSNNSKGPQNQAEQEGETEHTMVTGCLHPFIDHIMKETMPKNFRLLGEIEAYDRTADPQEHIDKFISAMVFQGESEAVMCRAFPLTLKKVARRWFASLSQKSINSWKELERGFLNHFTTSREQPKSSHCLARIKQDRDESLRDYIARFTKESLTINNLDQQVALHLIIAGLCPGGFARSLAKKPPQTMEDLRTRSEKWILLEDYEKTLAISIQEEKGKHLKVNNSKPPIGIKETHLPRSKYDDYTPLNTSRSSILREVMHTEIQERPLPIKSKYKNRNKRCEFHKDFGHDTEDCVNLRDAIEMLIREGKLRQYLRGTGDNHSKKRSYSPTYTRSKKNQDDRERNQRPLSPKKQRSRSPRSYRVESVRTPCGVINVIVGGFSKANRASRKRGPEEENGLVYKIRKNGIVLTFTYADFSSDIPGYDDPMVITRIITDYEVHQIFVDQGSLADIMYYDLFKKLGLDDSKLIPYQGNLIGFTGDTIKPKGHMELRVSLREKPNFKTIKVKFLVVECRSAYNVILGRPSLNALGAVVSTAHLAMKFPGKNGQVIIVKGNQREAQMSYAKSLKIAKDMDGSRKKVGERESVMLTNLDARSKFEELRPRPRSDSKEVQISTKVDCTVKIGAHLIQKLKERLVECLRRNIDLFAWIATDMPEIDPEVACHKLSILPGYKPVVLKLRRMGSERQ